MKVIRRIEKFRSINQTVLYDSKTELNNDCKHKKRMGWTVVQKFGNVVTYRRKQSFTNYLKHKLIELETDF